MRKISNYYKCIISLITISFCLNSYAFDLITANDNYHKFSFIFSSGINLSKIKDLDYSSLDNINSNYTLGVPINMGVDIKYKSNIGIELGIKYQFINTKVEQEVNESQTTKYSKEERFRFISFPLLMYYQPVNYKIKPSIFTGFSVNYLLNSYSKYTSNYLLNPEIPSFISKKYNNTENHNRWNVCYVFGIGINYSLNNSICIYINTSYSFGLTNLINVSSSGQYFDSYIDDLFIDDLNILIGIKLPLYFNK